MCVLIPLLLAIRSCTMKTFCKTTQWTKQYSGLCRQVHGPYLHIGVLVSLKGHMGQHAVHGIYRQLASWSMYTGGL